MKTDRLIEEFARLLGARIVTVPAPTPEQVIEMERREARVAEMSDDELIAAWESADDNHCCDDIWAEAQRRGLGDRVCV